MHVDRGAQTVSFGAGLKYGELVERLNDEGLALHNLASLPHISVAGAVATATHGSGVRNGSLATAVAALQLLTRREAARAVPVTPTSTAWWSGSAIRGVVTRLTLDVQPAFEVRQRVFEGLSFDSPGEHLLEEIASLGYSVSVFTDWSDTVDQVRVKSCRRAGPERRRPLRGGARDGRPHVIRGLDPTRTPQLGRPGPGRTGCPTSAWATPSAGEELQVGVPDAASPCRGARGGCPRGRRPAAAAGGRGPHGRRRPAVDEHEPRRGRRGPALHVEAPAGGGRGGAPGPRERAGPVRSASALGQGLHRGCATSRRSTSAMRTSSAWSSGWTPAARSATRGSEERVLGSKEGPALGSGNDRTGAVRRDRSRLQSPDLRRRRAGRRLQGGRGSASRCSSSTGSTTSTSPRATGTPSCASRAGCGASPAPSSWRRRPASGPTVPRARRSAGRWTASASTGWT